MKVQTQTIESFIKSQAFNSLNKCHKEKHDTNHRKNLDEPKNVWKSLAWNLQTKSSNSLTLLIKWPLQGSLNFFYHKCVKFDWAHVVVIPHEADI